MPCSITESILSHSFCLTASLEGCWPVKRQLFIPASSSYVVCQHQIHVAPYCFWKVIKKWLGPYKQLHAHAHEITLWSCDHMKLMQKLIKNNSRIVCDFGPVGLDNLKLHIYTETHWFILFLELMFNLDLLKHLICWNVLWILFLARLVSWL